MAAPTDDTRTSYPYMSANQYWGLRNRFKRTVPGTVTLDWVIGALDTTRNGAGNVLPQLRLLGLTDADNKPTDLVHDFKDDDTYPSAAQRILEAAYPTALRDAHDDPTADPAKVAGWFSRNARTGERAALNQAKLYLLILGATLPDPEEVAPKPKPVRSAQRKTGSQSVASKKGEEQTVVPPPAPVDHSSDTQGTGTGTGTGTGGRGRPNLHVDLQIHISADAADAQIEAIFASMAKHLYGKE